MKPSSHRKIDRRQFLKLMGISGLSLLLTRCGLNPLPQDSSTPAPALPTATIASATSEPSSTPEPTSTPEPSATPVYAAWAAIGRVPSYDLALVRKELQAMLDGLGGLSDLVRPGARVGIKPNLTGGTWGDSSLPAPATELLPLTRLWCRYWPN